MIPGAEQKWNFQYRIVELIKPDPDGEVGSEPDPGAEKLLNELGAEGYQVAGILFDGCGVLLVRAHVEISAGSGVLGVQGIPASFPRKA